MVAKADKIEYFLTKNEEEALLLEEKLIKKYNPPYNSLLK
jgi:excinuclease ABC subunit C